MKKIIAITSAILFIYNTGAVETSPNHGKTSISKEKFSKSHRENTKDQTISKSSFGHEIKYDKVSFGIEGISSDKLHTTKSKAGEYVLTKKYSFGLAPRISYNLYKNLSGYVNFGTKFTKYKTLTGDDKKNPTKKEMFVGIGVEQNFGTIFIRGEVNKVFKKSISKFKAVDLKADKYTFKIGGGYRF